MTTAGQSIGLLEGHPLYPPSPSGATPLDKEGEEKSTDLHFKILFNPLVPPYQGGMKGGSIAAWLSSGTAAAQAIALATLPVGTFMAMMSGDSR